MVNIDGINIDESQYPVQLASFEKSPRLFLSDRFTNIVLIRPIIIQKVLKAIELLPNDHAFMICESYRPRSRQFMLWEKTFTQLLEENPGLPEDALIRKTEIYVSNPYKFGSGHQAAAAIDITLCTLDGIELDMGTRMQEFNAKTKTYAPDLSKEIEARRKLLKSVLEEVGLINYPAEWWHFSYGDRLWAEITGRDFAFFAPID